MVEIAQGNLRYIEAFCLLLALSGYPICFFHDFPCFCFYKKLINASVQSFVQA